jgi:hypothetical protein
MTWGGDSHPWLLPGVLGWSLREAIGSGVHDLVTIQLSHAQLTTTGYSGRLAGRGCPVTQH